MSTYGTFHCLDLTPGADPASAGAALRGAGAELGLDTPVELWLSEAPDGGARLLAAAHGDPGLVPAAVVLLLAEGVLWRALVAIDGDEYGTQHAVLVARDGEARCVHAVLLVNPRNAKDPIDPRSPAYLETAAGLVDPGGPLWSMRRAHLPADARNGRRARSAAAELFGVDPVELERAHANVVREPHMLEAFWDTYGPWWKALGVPLPPWTGTPI